MTKSPIAIAIENKIKESDAVKNMDEKEYAETIDFINESLVEALENIEIINLREIPRDQAKQEIKDYLKKRGQANTADIADDLRLEMSEVEDITEELIKEGIIGEV